MDLLALIAFIPTVLILTAGIFVHLSDRGYTFDLRRRARRQAGGRRFDDPQLRPARP